MGMYRKAAEIVLRRQVGIYGLAAATHVANLSGYEIDSSGLIISVEDEDKAFNLLVENTEKYLGSLAAINCRTALMVCSSSATDMVLRQLTKESEDIVLSVTGLNNAIAVFKLSEESAEASMNDGTPLFTKPEKSSFRSVNENTAHPAMAAMGFLQRVFGFLL